MNLRDPLENCVTQANIIFRELVDNHTSILYNNNVVNGGNDMINVIGIGQNRENMTLGAIKAIEESDVIIGYKKYINQ